METVNAQKEQKNKKYKKVTRKESEYIESDSDDDFTIILILA